MASDQSGLTGIRVKLAPIASENRRTSLDLPVPEIPERITKGLDLRER